MRPQNVIAPLVIVLQGHAAVAVPIFGALGNMVDSFLSPLTGAVGGGSGSGSGQTPTSEQIDTAARAWRNDTGTVSNFLSNAESMDPQELQRQGKIALDAENDELLHKAVLDRMFLNGTAAARDAGVADANDVLVNQDTFQFIVDGLTLMSKRGSTMKPDEVKTLVRAMNQDRCPYVLPAIDKYMAAAQGAVPGGDKSLKAYRPTNC
ncbi:hypothetical protein H634G_05208 [Metarhizium anisopliae BRIP 53293]|uniref:Uncharacterized protein n=1 Tax=Metarhizium anisopliae BRIP 53293 TaxID=1291518 RepID=A0A0D9P0L3_METAN|nr:hypothetical protein H634G_05208 [Metarhizium anisopliae BRIP 53293]KJK90625.1 hypothetical protein H633G_05533 [Metarhizium anisopliae BRIP 53284]